MTMIKYNQAAGSGSSGRGSGQPKHWTPEEIEDIEAAGAVSEEQRKPDPRLMRIDLHCHSEASPDCSTPLDRIPDRCRERGIAVQAITDHNQIWGARKLVELAAEEQSTALPPVKFIVGEEITTRQGELIGLFLQRKVKAGLSPEETVAEIQEQGGLVLLPHGFDPLKRWRLKPDAREDIAGQIDIVETFNTRISQPRWNREAVRWAEEHDTLMSAGSDAHTLADIGSAWVEVPGRRVEKPQDLLSALRGGVPVGKWRHPVVAFLYKLWDRTRRRALAWVR